MDKLLPCPFCGGDAEFDRMGDRRQSCIVSCEDCGCRHESSDEYDNNGRSWNTRHTPEGWVLVPAEADDWMCQAFNDQHELSYNPASERKYRPIHTWKRMLAAAPTFGGK